MQLFVGFWCCPAYFIWPTLSDVQYIALLIIITGTGHQCSRPLVVKGQNINFYCPDVTESNSSSSPLAVLHFGTHKPCSGSNKLIRMYPPLPRYQPPMEIHDDWTGRCQWWWLLSGYYYGTDSVLQICSNHIQLYWDYCDRK